MIVTITTFHLKRAASLEEMTKAFFLTEKLPKRLRHRHNCKKCPVNPRKRTCAVQLGMSALGQKQTYAAQQVMSALPPIATAKEDFPQNVMSALPPKADMCSAPAHVCLGQ